MTKINSKSNAFHRGQCAAWFDAPVNPFESATDRAEWKAGLRRGLNGRKIIGLGLVRLAVFN